MPPTLSFFQINAKKRIKSRATPHSTAYASSVRSRLYIYCDKKKIPFLIDTGASVSLFPNSHLKRTTAPNDPPLYAANESRIQTYGTVTLPITFGTKTFSHEFLVADVPKSILGIDFLAFNNLSVILPQNSLYHSPSKSYFKCTEERFISSSVSIIEPSSPYKSLLDSYLKNYKPPDSDKYKTLGIEHFIITTGPPIKSKARPLNPDFLKQTKAEFNELMNLGILRPSKSPWSSPLHVVRKQNGTVRPCGDYRRLNLITVDDNYGVPNLRDFNTLLFGKSIFSTLDISRAFHHIPIRSSDIPKTAIITPFGLYEYTKLGFGFKGAPQTYQRFMDSILRDFDFAFCYLDDVLLASNSPEQHRQHLELILNKFLEFGIKLNLDKCVFGQPNVNFLGHVVDGSGIKPLPEKVKAIIDYPEPKTICELRRFLGMINFYRRAIPHAAKEQRKLTALFGSSKKRDKTPVPWTPDLRSAFNNCKFALQNCTLLYHPHPSAPLILASDASDVAMGSTLYQLVNSIRQPLGFFSKSFSPTQQKYSTFDRELLAIFESIRYFKPQLEGRIFSVETDHKPLVNAIKMNEKIACPRRIRQLSYISEFTTSIVHRPGSENLVPDALSRIADINIGYSVQDIATQQTLDPKLIRKVHEIPRVSSKRFQLLKIDGSDVWCENSGPQPRPFIPEPLRHKIFLTYHNISHPGIRASRKLISQRVFWPQMYADIKLFTKACNGCQKAKSNIHHKHPPVEFPDATKFSHIHLDLVGPLPPCQGKRYLLTIIDRATRWPEAYPLSNIETNTIADTLISQWISRYGVPLRISTDRGTQFESHLFNSLTESMGIQKLRTCAYHPKSNGILERYHRTLKTAITAGEGKRDWVSKLPFILLFLRSTVSDADNASPTQRVFNANLRLPGDLISPTPPPPPPTDSQKAFFQNVMRRSARVFTPRDLQTASHVFVKVPHKESLTPTYTGPFKVLERTGSYVTIQSENGTPDQVTYDRCKPAYFLPGAPRDDPPTLSSARDIPPGFFQPPKHVRFDDIPSIIPQNTPPSN